MRFYLISNKQMSVNKYDRKTLKWQFFQSEILDIKTWWEWLGNKYNSGIQRNALWRKLEKEKRKESLVDKVMEVAEQEFIETYKPDIQELWKYHKLIMWIVAKKLVSMAKKEKEADDIFVWDIEKLRKMIKTEKNEPTVVTRSTGEMKFIPISDEDKKKCDQLLDNNIFWINDLSNNS